MSTKNSVTSPKLGENLFDSKDVGSFTAQIVFFTRRINSLTEHAQKNKKDLASIRGLKAIVNSRLRMIKFAKANKETEKLNVVLRALNLDRLIK